MDTRLDALRVRIVTPPHTTSTSYPAFPPRNARSSRAVPPVAFTERQLELRPHTFGKGPDCAEQPTVASGFTKFAHPFGSVGADGAAPEGTAVALTIVVTHGPPSLENETAQSKPSYPDTLMPSPCPAEYSTTSVHGPGIGVVLLQPSAATAMDIRGKKRQDTFTSCHMAAGAEIHVTKEERRAFRLSSLYWRGGRDSNPRPPA